MAAVFALHKEIQFHLSFSQSGLSITLNVIDNFLQLLFIRALFWDEKSSCEADRRATVCLLHL